MNLFYFESFIQNHFYIFFSISIFIIKNSILKLDFSICIDLNITLLEYNFTHLNLDGVSFVFDKRLLIFMSLILANIFLLNYFLLNNKLKEGIMNGLLVEKLLKSFIFINDSLTKFIQLLLSFYSIISFISQN